MAVGGSVARGTSYQGSVKAPSQCLCNSAVQGMRIKNIAWHKISKSMNFPDVLMTKMYLVRKMKIRPLIAKAKRGTEILALANPHGLNKEETRCKIERHRP